MNVDRIMVDLERKHPGEREYHQAVREVLESIEDFYNTALINIRFGRENQDII